MTELPLVSIKKYIDELDDSIILAFKAFSEEKQRKLMHYVNNATNQASFYKALKSKDYIIFPLEGWKIDFRFNEVAFTTKIMPIYYNNIDDVINTLEQHAKATIYVKAHLHHIRRFRNAPIKVYADEIKLLIADYDRKTAKQLLNEYEPLDLIAYACGYIPAPQVKALLLPRILPLFRPFGMGVHVIQFTPPQTGKSHTSRILSNLTNSYYCTSFPSRAKLIGDARFNSYGLCYKYDAIYIEELDKLSGKKIEEFREGYDSLFTGLEQGIWQREKSSKTDIAYNNPVSFCFFGNVRDSDLSSTTLETYTQLARGRLTYLIEDLTGVNAKPFIERFTYIEYLTKSESIMKYINLNEENQTQYLHPAVSRAIFDILKEKCIKHAKRPRQLTNRMDRHFNTLYSILNTLNLNIDDNAIEALTLGNTNFYSLLVKSTSDTPKEHELSESDLNKMLEEGI